jgi:hypothetical protein
MHSHCRYGTVLQNSGDLDTVRGLRSEICPASHDAYPAVIMKTEVPSDAEEEECPLPLTFVGIKAEPEVSCVSTSLHFISFPLILFG